MVNVCPVHAITLTFQGSKILPKPPSAEYVCTFSHRLLFSLLFFFSKTSLGNADWVSTDWDSNQVQRFVGPDPDPNRFVKATSRQHKLVDIRWTSRSNGWFSHDRFQLLSSKMTVIEGRILTKSECITVTTSHIVYI